MAGFLLAGAICGGIVLSGHRLLIHFGLPYGVNVVPLDIIGSLLLTEFIFQVLFISIFWGLVNLMPIYPLDGGQIARELLMLISPRDGFRLSLMLLSDGGRAVGPGRLGAVEEHICRASVRLPGLSELCHVAGLQRPEKVRQRGRKQGSGFRIRKC